MGDGSKTLKIDLHNHSIYSHDSLNRLSDFEEAYNEGKFDVIAITDHQSIAAAKEIKNRANFPVIVGQEIASREGDLIGLFVDKLIDDQLDATATAQKIRQQGGLVYVPHPLDRFKIGMRGDPLFRLADKGLIDLIELYNGKYASLLLGWNNSHVREFIEDHGLLAAAGSDAHVPSDLGHAFVEVPDDFDPYELASNPQLLLQAIQQGTPKNLSRFTFTQALTIIYSNFRRKLISQPRL